MPNACEATFGIFYIQYAVLFGSAIAEEKLLLGLLF